MSALFKSSRVYLLFVLASLLQGTFAHTYLSSVFLGDQALSEGDCLRAHPTTAFDSPIGFLNSTDMICGFLPSADQKANRKCPVAAGSKFGLQWYHNSVSPSDDIIQDTHSGPLMVYMAKSENGKGNVWFKIYEDGFKDGKWAVDRLIANRGRVDFTLPSDIAPGNYLLRGEILALHNGYALDGVQPYVGCAELTISGNGNANPVGVPIPGVYKNTDPGMLFDKYGSFTSYPIPGPAVYKSGSNPSSSSSSSSSSGSISTPPPAAATSRPTIAATVAPVDTNNNNNNNNNYENNNNNKGGDSIKVGLNGGTGVWWVGAIVSGGGETTVKVEMMDSSNVKSWTAMKDEGYAYTFNNNKQFSPPISLRVTSSSGKQVVFTNIFTAFSSALIDTGKTYTPSSPSTSAPTSAPTKAPTNAPTNAATKAPTNVPTNAPTNAPTKTPTSPPSNGNNGNVKITIRPGSSEWWLSFSLSSEDISSVEIKDSGSYSTYSAAKADNWGQGTVYTFTTSGAPLVAPVSARITSKSGKVITASFSSFATSSVIETSGSL